MEGEPESELRIPKAGDAANHQGWLPFQELVMFKIHGNFCSRFMIFFVLGECAAVQEGCSKFWLQLSAAKKSLGAAVREAPGVTHI